MVERRNILAALAVALISSLAVQADFMGTSQPEMVPSSVGGADKAEFISLADPFALLDTPSGVDPGPVCVEDLLDPGNRAVREDLPRLMLVDRSDSVDLCLYALLGLGLCRSGQLVRKSSLAFIPQWYHHGAPFQIGHSYAIGPDCLGSNLPCFIQPQEPPKDIKPHYRQEVVVCLWRISQFTPIQLASRAPPSNAHEWFVA